MSFTRRNFLKNSGLSALGAASLGGLPGALTAFNAHAADTSGYKALVCVFLFGGLDNYDTMLPFDQPSYDRLAEIRADLFNQYGAESTRSRSRLLPLTPTNSADFGGRQFALTEEMSGIHNLFQQGNAAIVSNVGPLLQPTTRTQFEADTVPTPARLFSHNDQQSTWLSNAPEGAAFGWGGLFADQVFSGVSRNAQPFATMTTSGNRLFLTGRDARPFQIGSDGAARVNFFNTFGEFIFTQEDQQAFDLMTDHFRADSFTTQNLLEQDTANAIQNSFEVNATYGDALEALLPFATPFPRNRLGRQLRSIAEAISVRSAIGANRQVFFVSIGGFDTHSNQANDLPARQVQISEAITAFYAAMEETGAENEVTLFTASDFGRTLAINGDGTDHGWGGTHFVVGGAVQGNTIYGDIPPYDFDHEFDAGRGRLIPSTSIEQYAAPLGSWFGLNEAELASVFPNLATFSARPSLLA